MSILDTVAVLISITAVFSYFNHRVLKLPTTIGVMLISLVLSLCVFIFSKMGFSDYTNTAVLMVENIDFTEVVLNCMLSLLLFAGALHVDINDLREQRWPIGCLATAGVITTTIIIGFSSYFILGVLGLSVPIIYCMIFGALISPTDPIAVLGILKSVGAPKSLETKIVGESLLNDGVALVLFLVLLSIAVSPDEMTVSNIVMLFIEEVVGGVIFGVILGYIGFLMIRSVDAYQVEIMLTMAIVIGGYTLAQNIHVSGPLAIVVAGLMIGNKGRLLSMSDKTRENLDTFWELIDEIVNSLLFVLIGVELLALNFTSDTLLAGLVLIPVVLLARLVSTGTLVAALKKRISFTKNAVWILTWGGLRGAISVALALSLPQGETRGIIVEITYIVVVFSILVQGLTIGPLINYLIPGCKKS